MDEERLTAPQPPRLTPFEFGCPYCQHVNRVRLQQPQADQLARAGRLVRFRDLVSCDSEEGGCDRDFVISVDAELRFDVKSFPIRGLDRNADLLAPDPAPDLRVWILKTTGADEPGGGETEHFDAAQLEEMVPRAGRPLAALALTMRRGDSFEFVSVEGLITYRFECYEPEESDRFASFLLAKREARRRALNSGSPVEIYFDGEDFRLYRTNPLPLPPPAPDFERILTVEVPVLFRIQTQRVGVHSTIDAPEGWSVAEVFCDDERANPDLQQHGNSDIFRTQPFQTPEAAALEAAEWIRAEFEGKFDFEIESPFDVEPEDFPL